MGTVKVLTWQELASREDLIGGELETTETVPEIVVGMEHELIVIHRMRLRKLALVSGGLAVRADRGADYHGTAYSEWENEYSVVFKINSVNPVLTEAGCIKAVLDDHISYFFPRGLFN